MPATCISSCVRVRASMKVFMKVYRWMGKRVAGLDFGWVKDVWNSLHYHFRHQDDHRYTTTTTRPPSSLSSPLVESRVLGEWSGHTVIMWTTHAIDVADIARLTTSGGTTGGDPGTQNNHWRLHLRLTNSYHLRVTLVPRHSHIILQEKFFLQPNILLVECPKAKLMLLEESLFFFHSRSSAAASTGEFKPTRL